MKKLFLDKKYIGIWASIIIGAAFFGLSVLGGQFLDGTVWYLYSSMIRLIFGIAILFFIKKIYGKSIGQLLKFKNSGRALLTGIGFIVYAIYFVVDICCGYAGIAGLTMGLLVSKLFLQQLTTGFFEELLNRVLVTEGYFHGKRVAWRKLLYALASFVLFGTIHILTGWDLHRFLFTGTIGFAFAVIYLNTGNIIIPMLLHFVYDIFANLADFIEWNNSELFNNVNGIFDYVVIGMFVISFAMIFMKDKAVSTTN